MLKDQASLPSVPDKIYFSIGEASKLCAVRPHVLRYWEEEFTQLRPVTRSGQRRYYKKEHIHLIRTIRELLYIKGFTIAGAKQHLKTNAVTREAPPQEVVIVKETTQTIETDSDQVFPKAIVQDLLGDLEALLGQI